MNDAVDWIDLCSKRDQIKLLLSLIYKHAARLRIITLLTVELHDLHALVAVVGAHKQQSCGTQGRHALGVHLKTQKRTMYVWLVAMGRAGYGGQRARKL